MSQLPDLGMVRFVCLLWILGCLCCLCCLFKKNFVIVLIPGSFLSGLLIAVVGGVWAGRLTSAWCVYFCACLLLHLNLVHSLVLIALIRSGLLWLLTCD